MYRNDRKQILLPDPSVSAIWRHKGIGNYDMDKLIVNYITRKVVAAEEWKFGDIPSIDMRNDEIQCLSELMTAAGRAFWVVAYFHYAEDGFLIQSKDYPPVTQTDDIQNMIKTSSYLMISGNEQAKTLLGADEKAMSARAFWQFHKQLSDSPLCDPSKYSDELYLPYPPKIWR